jgi:hemin uptake protein HemP
MCVDLKLAIATNSHLRHIFATFAQHPAVLGERPPMPSDLPLAPPRPVSGAIMETRRVYRSEDLLSGDGEVVIKHRDQLYRLKLTSNDKLILVK